MKVGDKITYKGKTCLVADINYPIYSLYEDRTGNYVEAHVDDLRGNTQPVSQPYSAKKQIPSSAWDVPVSQPRYVRDPYYNPYTEHPVSTPTCNLSQVGSACIPVSKSNQNKNEKDGIKMNINKLFGDFGKVTTGEVALTFDGKVAVKRKDGDFVRYDVEKEQIVNNMGLVLEAVSKFFYIFPVATVAKDDIIKFKGKYYQVLEIQENGSVKAINLEAGTASTICKETNAFGINFYYKVTSLFGATQQAEGATPAFNPMMLALLDKDSDDSEDLLPLLLMSGGLGTAGGTTSITSNPLLLMSLLGDKKGGSSDMKDILMLQAFSGQGATAGGIDPMMLLLLNK